MTKTEAMFENRCPYDHSAQGYDHRTLFVCTAGLLRSPTGARVGASMGLNTRSCGTSLRYALVPISVNLVNWAETIYFVNEENYHEALDLFPFDSGTYTEILNKSVILDIPDDYDYMDPQLVKIFTEILT